MVKLNKRLRNDMLLQTHKERYERVGIFKGNEAKLLDKPVGAYCEDFQPPHRHRDGVP